MRLSCTGKEIALSTSSGVKDYWELATPWGRDMPKGKESYEERRRWRYGLQDYMHEAFGFDKWRGKRVLEIGCGSGIDAIEFARHGAVVTATDMTDNAVALTRSLAGELGLPVEVVQAPADSLPFGGGTFDVAYCYGVLHHIPDVDKAMAEIHRVLRDNGVVMAMLYHRDSLLYAYSIAYLHGIRNEGWLKGSLLGNTLLTEGELASRYSERIEGCPYTKAYTKGEAKELFGRWFGDVEISVHYNVLDLPGQRKVKFEIDGKWELGWHLAVRGIKR
jgi:2-polyprenyl-3-methyl-5-hydroxy-6-metoxy-1,4-benzoquinol methylase